MLAGLLFVLELEENTMTGVGLDLMCLAVYPIALVVLKKTGNFFLCATFLLTTLVAVIITGIQITGGYMESPILQLLLQPPVTAFLLLGLRPGIFWSLATAFICLLCYLSALLGVGYVQLLQSDALIHAMHFLLQITLLIVVAGVLLFALLACLSRGGWLAAGAALLFLIAVAAARTGVRRVLPGAVVLLVLVGATLLILRSVPATADLFPRFGARLARMTDGRGRLPIWSASFQVPG